MDVFYICVGACVICVMVCVCIYQVYQMYLESKQDAWRQENAHLYLVLYEEFIVDNHCGLCGNSGLINIITYTKTYKKLELNNAPCICPNGRQLKAQRDG